MKTQNLFFLILLTILSFSCKKNKIPTFINDWDEDVYWFGRELSENHKDLFFQLSKAEFDSDITTLRKNTAQLTDDQIIVELTKLISKIGDSHTFVNLGRRLKFLPIQIQWLDDGVFITRIDETHQQWIGEKIIGVNGHPIETVMDSFRTVIAYENESWFKTQAQDFFTFFTFHHYFAFAKPARPTGGSNNELIIDLESGNQISLKAELANMESFSSPITPSFLANMEENYWWKELSGNNLLYVQYNACRERNDLAFKDFTQQIVDLLEGKPAIKKIAIDLRHNGGGNSTIAKPLINALESMVKKGRLDSKKIFVIIGRKTFSSAVLNAIQLKQKVNPIFIGEPSGGKPNHFGELKNFELPNSKLKVWYSSKYFEWVDDDDNALQPSIFVEYNSTHLFSGIDPVMDRIKKE